MKEILSVPDLFKGGPLQQAASFDKGYFTGESDGF